MKCHKHPPPDHTGVCASCLRERLFSILVAQQSQKPETKQPITFQFPQSVSPYISRQNTHTHPFHYTPQVGPTKKNNKGGGSGWKLTSLFLGLFGSKQKKPGSGLDPKQNRGMSPVDEEWKQTPKRTAAATRSNNLSVFCLSPLVRPGPNRRQTDVHLSTMPSFCKNRSRKLAHIGRCNY